VILFGLFSSPTLMGQTAKATSALSVRQEVDLEILNLQKNVKAAKTLSGAFKAMEKSEARMAALRSKAPRQSEPDEIYMDYLREALKEIPRGKAFKKSDCDDDRSQIIVKYDPQGSETPTNPAITKTLNILKSLCKR
jgi:hypothetical protein